MRDGADDLIVVVDQGTSSVKFAAFDFDGHLVKRIARPTEIHLLGADTMEASPERWWSVCAQALRDLLSSPPVRSGAVRAVGLCGVMHTLVPVDARGRALRAVPLWADQRYLHQEACAYRDLMDQIADPSASSCVGRLAWMFETDASLQPSTRHLLPVKDFLRFKLTGVAATDYYEAEGTGLAGSADSGWSPERVGRLGLNASFLPPILRPDELVGNVTALAAEVTGLPVGTPVVAGTTDWHAALIGSDAVLPGRASLYLGTAGVLGGFCGSHDLSSLGDVACFGAVTSTGSAIDWVARLIAPDAVTQPDAGAEAIAALAEQSAPGANGVTFLPHLMGERGDEVRPDATAVFTGLRVLEDRPGVAPGGLVRPAPGDDLGDRGGRLGHVAEAQGEARRHDDLVRAHRRVPVGKSEVADPDGAVRPCPQVDDTGGDEAVRRLGAVAAGVHPDRPPDRPGDPDRPLHARQPRRRGRAASAG